MAEVNDAPESFYIHLQHLPWSASHSDVQKLFEGMSVPPGGISIFMADAFIVLTNKEDMIRALYLNEKFVLGKPVLLTKSTKQEFFRRKYRQINRRLCLYKSPTSRRIRPTAVPEEPRDAFAVFNPAEIEGYDASFSEHPKIRKIRKVRPTLLRELHPQRVFNASNRGPDGQGV